MAVEIKTWATDLDNKTMDQAINLSNLPFAFKHIALMADAHMGYGMPIGGVLATENVIIPNAVGVDIGCGMLAVKISSHRLEKHLLPDLAEEIKNTIPTGFNKNSVKVDSHWMPSWGSFKNIPIVDDQYENARYQLGTLGGGNHFIEIQEGDDGHTWIMIHSGSRHLGHKVATHYNKLAKELNAIWHTSVDPKHDLAFLPSESSVGQAYLQEMDYCLEYAYQNRSLMLSRVHEAIIKVYKKHVTFSTTLNKCHNEVRKERHFGKNVWVHRKGATSAKLGEMGVVPGSQGTNSYIVSGKGNRDSFFSCSHGAGRILGRKAAKQTLDFEAEKARLDDLGVVHGMTSIDNLDEAPGAYKDIEQVMENQKDLVDIMVSLTPLASIKASS